MHVSATQPDSGESTTGNLQGLPVIPQTEPKRGNVSPHFAMSKTPNVFYAQETQSEGVGWVSLPLHCTVRADRAAWSVEWMNEFAENKTATTTLASAKLV